MGSVTISALLHDGYYDEKKKKKANGDVGHNSCPGTNGWALIGAVDLDGTRRASGCAPAWASSEVMTSGYSRGASGGSWR